MQVVDNKNIGKKEKSKNQISNSALLSDPVTGEKIKTSLILITPDMAMKLLDRNHVENRRVKPKVVANYAEQITLGLWKPLSGEAVKISRNGKLIDGQHRLHAIINAGKPTVMLVIENIPDESITAIDDGAKRTLSDAMQIHGFDTKNFSNKMLSSMVISLDVMRNAAEKNYNLNIARAGRNASNVFTLEFAKRIPNLFSTIEEFANNFDIKSIGKTIPVGTSVMPLFYIFNQIDSDFTYKFFKTIETKMPCDDLGENSPSFAVYNAIINYKMKKVSLRLHDYFEMFVWAMEKTNKELTFKQIYRKKTFLITGNYMHSDKVMNILGSLE